MIDDPLEQAAAWLAAGQPAALATVIATWGSSPRPPGSKLAVNRAGEMVGSVSGGCIEAAVIEQALQVMDGAAPRTVEYGVTDEMAWEVGLACGGRVEVFVEPVGDLAPLLAARRAKRPVALITDLDGGERRLVEAGADDPLAAEIAEALRTDRARTVESGGGRLFVEPHNPPLRLAIIGAVHIAQPLAAIAAAVGFAVIVIDPRGAFATAARFPGVDLRGGWADEELEALAIDGRTAIVALTHDPKIDDPGLQVALRSPAFYVGALGSKKTQARRRERLAAAGFEAPEIDRISGPVGLAIGARTPAEIAVSILAEVIEVLRRH
jgi:xanthine dehydrogenase accessory factor